MFFNNLKTVILLGSLSGLLLLLGAFSGGQTGVTVAFVMAALMSGIAYFFSDRIVLRMYQAKPLDKDQHKQIFSIVSDLARTMNLPMPKLWIINTPMANAFATGRNPGHSSVAVTTGILSLLDESELRGVLAHELSHIKNRDILISTVAATIAAAIGYLAYMLRYAAFWQSMSSNRNRNSGGPFISIVIALLVPIGASLIQLAISRSREYLADETGALSSHDPLALASALEKLHNNVPKAHLDENDTRRASTAPLFIVHPFSGKNWVSLFSTHPPVNERIKRLRQIKEKMFS